MKQAQSKRFMCAMPYAFAFTFVRNIRSNIAPTLLTTTRGAFKWGIWELNAIYNPGQNILGHLRK